jgi:hypothetical protein
VLFLLSLVYFRCTKRGPLCDFRLEIFPSLPPPPDEAKRLNYYKLIAEVCMCRSMGVLMICGFVFWPAGRQALLDHWVLAVCTFVSLVMAWLWGRLTLFRLYTCVSPNTTLVKSSAQP